MSPALPFSSVCCLSLAPQVKGHGGQASTDLTGLPSAGRQEKFVLSLLRMEVEKKTRLFKRKSHSVEGNTFLSCLDSETLADCSHVGGLPHQASSQSFHTLIAGKALAAVSGTGLPSHGIHLPRRLGNLLDS